MLTSGTGPTCLKFIWIREYKCIKLANKSEGEDNIQQKMMSEFGLTGKYSK